jgi:uncharacterized protein (DUF58 family)
MTFRVGRRMPGMVVAAIVVYAVAANSLVVWLYLVCAMLIATIPIGIAGPLAASRPVTLRVARVTSAGFAPPLPQDRGRVFAGDRVALTLTGDVDLDRCTLGPVRCGDGALWDVRVLREADGDTVLEGVVATRGSIGLASIRYRCTWPLGLATVDRWIPLHADLVVHPRYSLSAPRRGDADRNGDDETQRRGYGDTFAGVREYRSGDSRRHVHWPATARMGELLVVETTAAAVSPARFGLQLLPGCDIVTADRAVYIAASLIAGCAEEGRPFRLAGTGPPGSVSRWRDALTALAMVCPPGESVGADAPPAPAGGITIAADAHGVVIAGATDDPVVVAMPAADEDVLLALQRLQ